MGLIDLTPAGYLSRFAKAIVGAAGGLLGLGGGGEATSPPPPSAPSTPDPIIDLGNGIVIPSLEAIPDNTILIMAGIILLAIYGGWTLIRGRRA